MTNVYRATAIIRLVWQLHAGRLTVDVIINRGRSLQWSPTDRAKKRLMDGRRRRRDDDVRLDGGRPADQRLMNNVDSTASPQGC